jgi:hypothetical protein
MRPGRATVRLTILAVLAAGTACGARRAGPAMLPGATRLVLAPPEAAYNVAARTPVTGHELGDLHTFDALPRERWRADHGVAPDDAWVATARGAAVRIGDCSGAFVSPDGLLVTNQHCVRECLEAASRGDRDLLRDGFLAPRRGLERNCPGLSADRLRAARDVTDQVRAEEGLGRTVLERESLRNAAIARIETECVTGRDTHCRVASLHQGARLVLYEYRRYSPVRLVFAPEAAWAGLGGPAQSFAYPRHALDVAFLRAYDGDVRVPASTPLHFRWHPAGGRDGDVVFAVGHPGATYRQITLAQFLYESLYRHPFLLGLVDRQREALRAIAALGGDAARQAQRELAGYELNYRAYGGQLAALRDTLVVGAKLRWERELRARVELDPALRAAYGHLWDRSEALQREKLALSPRLNLTNRQVIGAPHMLYAGTLVGYVREAARPEAERPEGFRGAGLARTEAFLRAGSETAEAFAGPLLRLYLEFAVAWLTPDDPVRTALVAPGETADAAYARLMRETRVLDPAFRDSIMRGGVRALERTTDPVLRFASLAEPAYQEMLARWRPIAAEERQIREGIARAALAVFGPDLPSDGTLSPRVSAGVVRGAGTPDAPLAPHATFLGLYARAAEAGHAGPWKLPDRVRAARERLDLDTPITLIATNDVAGGSAGSALVDAEGRLVGIVFDNDTDHLGSRYLYRPGVGRAIAVHAAGVDAALRRIYDATALLEELGKGGR